MTAQMSENLATPEHPIYKMVSHHNPDDEPGATELWFITCDEGWRQQVVCERMYKWAAEWLLNQIQGEPFANGSSEENQ